MADSTDQPTNGEPSGGRTPDRPSPGGLSPDPQPSDGQAPDGPTISSGPRRVVIVGAGISGLTTAYRLLQTAAERGQRLEVRVLEASNVAGGTLQTSFLDGFLMEQGPDSIIREKPWALRLMREIGLGDEIIGTKTENRGSFVARGTRLHRVPEGFHLMAPSRIAPWVTTSIFSWPGKLRMAADLILPRGKGGEDETLAEFVRRRLGNEALERMAQPMVGGIYTADPEKLSLAATMPRFLDLEREQRSLILAMVANRMRAEKTAASVATPTGESGANASAATATGARYDLFATPRNGMASIAERLVQCLPEGTIRFGTAATGLSQDGRKWTVRTAQEDFSADAVCIALPAQATATLLGTADTTTATTAATMTDIRAGLETIEYASSITMNLAFEPSAISRPLDGFGFVVPAIEKRTVIACTFSHLKYEGRAPDGLVLLRAFAGGALAPETMQMDDDQLLRAVLKDLGDLLGVRGRPRQVLISRWPSSMAQYHRGHMDRVLAIERGVGKLPGLELAGNGYRGVGIPDCVREAEAAAGRITRFLSKG